MRVTVRTVFVVCAWIPIAALFSVNALAESFIVNTDDDTVDLNVCDTEHCSLREAILEAEQNMGEDTILFDEDYVISPLELLPEISEKLIIDGSGHTVRLDGSDYLSSNSVTCPAQFLGDRSHSGLVFKGADNSKVKSMEIANWCNGITVEETNGGEWTDNLFTGNLGNAQLDFLNSNHNRTTGNVFWQDPIDPDNLSGDQIELQFSSWNRFNGNVFTGGENAYELLFESNYNVIEGDVIEAAFRSSIEVSGFSRGNVIRNNTITDGVALIVDGEQFHRGFANGISLAWGADDNVVEGNVISNIPNSGIAVVYCCGTDSDGNFIHSNTISNTGLAGIVISGGKMHHLSGNLISSVGGIGIDLSDEIIVVPAFGENDPIGFPNEVTLNDSGLDANMGQNYPVMDQQKSKWNRKLLLLKGVLQGHEIRPKQRYDVECFGNSSMVREAKVFVGSKTVVTNFGMVRTGE